jgi:hypothetical protein
MELRNLIVNWKVFDDNEENYGAVVFNGVPPPRQHHFQSTARVTANASEFDCMSRLDKLFKEKD